MIDTWWRRRFSHLSLDQLEAFVLAAETGSISAAARRLGKAQSAVSTAVTNLELGAGVKLFDRSKKYPVLTREGEVLLKDAQNVLRRVNGFLDRAYAFASTEDAHIRIAVDEIVPQPFLSRVLERFAEKFPQTELELLYGVLTDIQTLVEEGRADVGLLVPYDFPDKAMSARRLAYMNFFPVAAKDHPLAALKRIRPQDLEPHRQLCITSRGGEREPDSFVFGSRTWMVESSYVIRDLVCRGVGYAFLPLHLVEEELSSGRLVRLPLWQEMAPYQAPIYLIWSQSRSLGQAGMWLMQEFFQIKKAVGY